MNLRLATLEDAEILFKWRNNLETRLASRNADIIQWQAHVRWLAGVLADPDRQLYICEMAVGTVRIDLKDDISELSWTVAPEFREKGIGKQMVELLTDRVKGPIKAVIKPDNIASIKIAERAGIDWEKEN